MLAFLLPLVFAPLPQIVPPGDTAVRSRDAEKHGLPGARPGTERWCVIFKHRNFDLAAFRKAIQEGRPASEVRSIVRGLEEAARLDQAAFTTFVEKDLQGEVVARFWLINACTIEVKPSLLDRVRSHPKVAFIHPDEIVEPVAILTSTNSKNHAVDALQKLGIKGKGVSVAIMDTGCDVNMGTSGRPHSTYYVNGDIKNKTGGGIGGSRLLAAKALGKMPADDVHNHGTGVSGIAAGEKWNTKTNSDRGHAPMSGVVSYSIANNTRGSSDYTTIAKAWQAIAADKATYKIVAANNSYSGTPDPTNLSQQALDAAALNADVLPVVAGGNFSSSTSRSQSCANGLAVGAVNPNTRKMASFSSRGPLSGDTQRFYPDLCANGVGTVMPLRNNESSQYIASGTSMASPQVCGAATLFRSIRTTANALETKAAILATTEDVSKKNPTPPYNTRNAYGVGYLRDDRLIDLAKGKGLVTRGSLTSTVKTRTFVLPVTKAKGYAVVLTWHRSNLKVKTWSDLALSIKLGSKLLAQADTPRNLYEKAVFIAPSSGAVTITVTGKSLDSATVPFAVAASEVPPPFIDGSTKNFGLGCSGTVSTPLAVPGVYATKFGETAGAMPLGFFNSRVLQVFATKAVPSSFKATALVFRRNGTIWRSLANYWIEFQIDLGYAVRSPTALSPTFDSNLEKGGMTTVFSKKKLNLPHFTSANPSPFAWEIVIPFDKPYTYTAKTGRWFAADFRRTNSSTGSSSADYYVDVSNDKSQTLVSRVYAFGTSQTTGTVEKNWGAILGFKDPNGVSRAVPKLSLRTQPEIGKTLFFDLDLAHANTPAIFVLGASNTKWNGVPLPFDLGTAGAPGCKLLVSLDLLQVGKTSNFGNAKFSLAIPNDKNLIQGNLFFQGIVFDKAANKLGFSFTNGVLALIGGQP